MIPLEPGLTRVSHGLSTAATDPGISTALRSLGLLNALSSTSAGPSVALAGKRQMRLVSTPVYAASLQNPVRKAGWSSKPRLAEKIRMGTRPAVRLEDGFLLEGLFD